MKHIWLGLFVLLFATEICLAQIKGEQPPEFNQDTVFIFESPRPLISEQSPGGAYKTAYGLDLLFSENGFGVGAFYHFGLNDNLVIDFSLYISGARNTDEFEMWDPYKQEWRVPDKINRLFMFPLTVGLKQFIFSDALKENFRPNIGFGVGPTFILATDYDYPFFKSFGYSKWYTRLGGYVGFGAAFGPPGSSLMMLNIRYYYIPFGGDGLESIKGMPIKNFGGIFLSLSLGIKN